MAETKRMTAVRLLAMACAVAALAGCAQLAKPPNPVSDASQCTNACKTFDQDGQCLAYREDIPQQCAEYFARACATSPERCPKGNAYALIRVWYATDRAKIESSASSIE